MERMLTILALPSLLLVGAMLLVRSPTADPAVGRRRHAQADARMLQIALLIYQKKHGELPFTPTPGSSAPVYASGHQQNVYFTDLSPDVVSPAGEFLDPWKHPFTFRLAGDKIVVSSAGPDGRPENADDISSEN